MPRTSAIVQPSITIESATSLRSIRQPRSTETSGPTVDSSTTESGPITTGPRRTLRVTLAPAATTTVPSTEVASSTSPSIEWLRTDNIIRLASSRSSGLPVSFHQPSTISARTVRPWSTSH